MLYRAGLGVLDEGHALEQRDFRVGAGDAVQSGDQFHLQTGREVGSGALLVHFVHVTQVAEVRGGLLRARGLVVDGVLGGARGTSQGRGGHQGEDDDTLEDHVNVRAG